MSIHPAQSSPTRGRQPASTVLRDLAEEWEGERVDLDGLLKALEDRAYGFLILVLAVPNIVPNPVPGLSGVMGTPLALLCLQMALGRQAPWLPRTIGRRSVSAEGFRRVVRKAAPRLQRLERLLKPRLRGLTRGRAERLVALACVGLAILLALPIPFGNTPTALALTLVALGLIEHDGAYVVAGLLIGAAAVAVFGVLGWGALEAWRLSGAGA